jgi:hypothetical protein
MEGALFKKFFEENPDDPEYFICPELERQRNYYRVKRQHHSNAGRKGGKVTQSKARSSLPSSHASSLDKAPEMSTNERSTNEKSAFSKSGLPSQSMGTDEFVRDYETAESEKNDSLAS